VDPNKVKAEFKNGMLTVVAPIAEEAKEPQSQRARCMTNSGGQAAEA
jgi:HSP20 family molecular chaperone IbpA